MPAIEVVLSARLVDAYQGSTANIGTRWIGARRPTSAPLPVSSCSTGRVRPPNSPTPIPPARAGPPCSASNRTANAKRRFISVLPEADAAPDGRRAQGEVRRAGRGSIGVIGHWSPKLWGRSVLLQRMHDAHR